MLTVILSLLVLTATSQRRTRDVYVDKEGVMRWGDTKKEVYGFGVNYTVPFAHAYRAAKKLGVDLEKAIENDVYHFARLGFDAYRVHVWDTEISDSLGNLLENDHLRLFDFMLAKMKERQMKIFITPIAFWGNGYPESDEKTPGFSSKYGKDASLTNPSAIKAQENYLYQFLNHVNPYTKIAYKDDPDVVGFEVSNEPHHRGTPEEVVSYINKMVSSMKKTGCKKPILYNISHSIHLSKAYFQADIDGGTFQWYPTGLGAAHELRGNFLPNVDRYPIPFANEPGFRGGAKIVYEFDAADVGRSYIYPVMARSFRTAGIQWATHFAYDPTYLAYANTEYNTHFMNLPFAPGKALSLKIASEVFHNVPRYKDFGRFPGNTRFADFRVSYEEDLAEMVTPKKFIYTNHTQTVPPSVQTLEEIAGVGSSGVVKYEGKGAYFLDKLEDGVWRLEVMPDAIWVDNLFGRNSLDRTVAVVNYRTWPMRISIPGLGNGFTVNAISGEGVNARAEGSTISVKPGVYILSREGVTTRFKPSDKFRNIRIDEYFAPPGNLKQPYLLHAPYPEVTAGKPLRLEAKIITKEQVDSVVLHVAVGWTNRRIEMRHTKGYSYTANLPSEFLKEGYLNYYITTYHEGQAQTWPSAVNKSPQEWDFSGESFRSRVVVGESPLYIFNAVSDHDQLSREWRRGTKLIPADAPNDAVLRLEIPQLKIRDDENLNGPVVSDYSMRYNFAPALRGRKADLGGFSKIVLKGKAVGRDVPVQIALIDSAANTYGKVVVLTTAEDRYEVALDELAPVKMVILPRPYPTFLPYFFDPATVPGTKFNIQAVETLQISIGPGINDASGEVVFELQSVYLE